MVCPFEYFDSIIVRSNTFIGLRSEPNTGPEQDEEELFQNIAVRFLILKNISAFFLEIF